MILAFDTHYFDDKAKTVAIQFEHWTDEVPNMVYSETLTNIQPYESGLFYKRELPCILSLLQQIDLAIIDVIVIDGFVVLDDEGALGLGGYLYEALDQQIPIIGVAKNNFAKIDTLKIPVLRGDSKKLLYITAKGISLQQAASRIQEMHGEYRFPTLLKEVDRLGRE
ncbi:endonuclease V [uncultured Dokdonia sp.]|uniref:endonuclease V n=1 Tax=uncultured Dokdonia sp. TaxID=575653 RepID=UPI0026375B45|nr:endonuclease V [uncultured Dokdonia sp.]